MKTILRLSDYEDKDHFRQVQIYCIHLKRKVYIDTGVKTKVNLFDPLADQKIKGKDKTTVENNDILLEKYARIKKIIRDYKNENDDVDPDVFYVRDQFLKPKQQPRVEPEVKAAYKKWIEGDEEKGIKGKKHNVADIKIYRTVLRDIERLFPKPLYFKDLDYDFFQILLADWTSDKKNLQNSTVNKRTTCLRIYLRHEPKNKYKHYESFATGLKNLKLHPVIIPTDEEFEKIVNAENYVEKEKWTKDMDTARDYFVVGCSTSLRYGTISTLTRSDIITDNTDQGGYIKTFSRKTETSDVKIPLNDISRVFLEKLFQKNRKNYRIKFMSNWKVNKNLHELFKELKFKSIEKVVKKRGAIAVPIETEKWAAMTMHDSRAFFISQCVNSNTVSLGTTLDWSTHTGLQDVVKYIGKGHNQVEQMRQLFANILKPKPTSIPLDASALLKSPEEIVDNGA